MRKQPQPVTLKKVLIHFSLTVGAGLAISIGCFYLYLPYLTSQGREIVLPDLIGKNIFEVNSTLHPLQIRFVIGDSAYKSNQPPLTVLRQFPPAGHRVKINREIYLTINSTTAPTVPLPNLFGDGNSGSLMNAEAVLRSSELKRGTVTYTTHPNRDLIVDILYNGKMIRPGTRIPKGSTINLVVGDGGKYIGKNFVLIDLVDMPYQNALLRLENLSLRLGTVQITMDTAGVVSYVIKQVPGAYDSVQIGDPINLWIGTKDQVVDE